MNQSFLLFTEVFLTLLIILDPPGVIAPFLSLTKEYDSHERKIILKQAIGFSMVVLISMLFVGQAILDILGISTFALNIAGGILLVKFGYETMTGLIESSNLSKDDFPSYVPLGFPIIAGPGAITAIILLGNSNYQNSVFVNKYIVLIPIIILSLLLTYIVLNSSDRIKALIGEKSLNAVIKIVGLFIMTIGIQLVLSGLQGWFQSF